MAERFFAITTEFKRMKLDEAWSSASEDANSLRGVIEAFGVSASQGIDSTGGVQNSSSNGHSAGAFQPGQNQSTAQEMAEMWQSLLGLFDRVSQFLNRCATYGFQPFLVAYQTGFTFPLPAAAVPAVVLETSPTGNFPLFASACEQCGVAVSDVVGQAVGDAAIYVWMKTQELVAVRQTQNDYRLMGVFS